MNRKIFCIAVFSILFDQISKAIVGAFIPIGSSVTCIKNFFYLKYLENVGAAWNILNGRLGILIFVSIIAIYVFYRYSYQFKTNTRNNIAFGLIFGGILGNLIDRVFLGYVRDFLFFKIFNYNYPVFNLADTFIVIGVILLIIAILKGEDNSENNKCSGK